LFPADDELNYEVAKGNLETLLLHALCKKPMSACELITFFKEKLTVVFPVGTIYSKLYKLEREGKVTEDKPTFKITSAGREALHINLSCLTKVNTFLGETSV
jgi:DNA-binding PadR family transcriptional regulator